MKKLSIILMIISWTVSYAQTSATDTADKAKPANEKSALIWVRESDIPPSALRNLQRDAKIQKIERDIEKIGEYVSVGREIGMAVDTSLGALAYHVDHISKTNVGKFTMFMVGWKIMGEEAVSYLVGILMLFTFLAIWVWSWYKNFYSRRVPALITKKARRWYWPWSNKEVIEYQDYKKDKEEFGGSITYWFNYGESSYVGHILALVFGLLIIFFTAF